MTKLVVIPTHYPDVLGTTDHTDPRKFDIRSKLGDSAVLLGGATALLYFASHLYGSLYLGALGVRLGFQGFGLGNLAMLSLADCAFLFAASAASYYLLAYKRTRIESIAGALAIAAFVATPEIRLLVAKGYTSGVTRLIVTAVIWLVYIGLWIRFQAPKINKSANDVDASTARLAELRSASAPVHDLDALLTEHKELENRLRQTRRRVKLICGYLTTVTFLASIARTNAIEACEPRTDGRWTSIAPTDPPRIPVYWVDDRIVYVTNDGKDCFVHVQVAEAEVSRFTCPAIVRTASAAE